MNTVADVLKLLQGGNQLSDEDKLVLNTFTDSTNRSNTQTAFLFGLCDNDFDKLLLLEEKLKGKCYCPHDVAEVENVLSKPNNTYNYSQLNNPPS